MNLDTLPSQFQARIQELHDEAVKEAPGGLSPDAQTSWVVRRVLALTERERNRSRALQVLLAGWAYKTALWQLDEEQPATFKDYLASVGSERDGTTLSQSTVSDLAATAEIIQPYCESIGIDMAAAFSTDWGKFREAIPALRQAIEREEDPEPAVRDILSKVEQAPNRLAVREAFRQSRTPKPVIGDSLQVGDKICVALFVDPDDWPALKGQLSKRTQWRPLIEQHDQRLALHYPRATHDNTPDHS